MTFICNQDWDAMKVTERGRFCEACKHEVVDFSTKTIAEINAIKFKNGQLCGNFRIDQVEEGLSPIEFKSIKKTRYWFATIVTFFGLELTQLNAQIKNEVKTEYGSDSLKTGMNNSSANVVNEAIVKDKNEVRENFATKTPFMTTDKRKFYWSKRFPFIAIRKKRHLRGKF